MMFKVPEMSCGHCTAAIEKAVKAADPQADVTCDLADKNVTIESQLSADALKAVLKDAGYESELAA